MSANGAETARHCWNVSLLNSDRRSLYDGSLFRGLNQATCNKSTQLHDALIGHAWLQRN